MPLSNITPIGSVPSHEIGVLRVITIATRCLAGVGAEKRCGHTPQSVSHENEHFLECQLTSLIVFFQNALLSYSISREIVALPRPPQHILNLRD